MRGRGNTHPQHINNPKKTAIMKRIFFFAAMALATLLAGCNPDDGADNQGNQLTPDKLVGSWLMTGEDFSVRLVFLGRDEWTQSGSNGETSGTYTLDGDVLTMKMGDSITNQMRVIMLYDYNVLVLRLQAVNDEPFGSPDAFGLYYRENTPVAAPQADIQGKWFWYMPGDTNSVRGALEFSGNTFDFIIPVWHQRMRGTYQYVNGKAQFHVTEFMVREYMGDDDLSVGNLYAEWTTPEPGSGQEYPPFGTDFTKPFVANGDEAYALIANLPAYFEKQ